MPLPCRIAQLLEQLDGDQRLMPPTLLYNEGWMLRLVLDAGGRGLLPDFMDNNESWYSEAQLRTPFGRERGPMSESNTHPDGVVGDFRVIADTKSGLEVRQDATRLRVFEAKMYSPLSAGIKHARGYDQAARTVACMAYTLQQTGRPPDQFDCIGFYVVAPEEEIRSGIFDAPMAVASIRCRIEERIQQFIGPARQYLERWRDNWAWPLLDSLDTRQTLGCLPWEQLIEQLLQNNPREGEELREFYEKCKQYNDSSATRRTEVAGRPVRGREYLIHGGRFDGERVRVCVVGEANSRVYADNAADDAFRVPNAFLDPILGAEQTPAPHDPVAGQEYWWERHGQDPVRVCVCNVGDYNSRVVRMGVEGDSFKVPNHRLTPAN